MLDRGIQPAQLHGVAAGALSPGREPRPDPRLCAVPSRAIRFLGAAQATILGAYRSSACALLCRRSEDACRAPSAPGRLRTFNFGVTVAWQCIVTACVDYGSVAGVCLGSVANQSVLHPTRLETRTKESNMCASHRDHRIPKAQ